MIIFGSSTRMVAMAMLNLLCAFCGNPAAHSLRKRVTKFTLFFIPLFPIAPARHFLQCTFCGGTNEINKENAEQLLAQSGGHPQQGQQYGQPQQGQPYGQQPNPYQGQGQHPGYGQGQPPQPAQPPQPGYGPTPPQGNPFAGNQPQPPQNPYQR